MPDTDVSAFNTSEGTVTASATRFVTAARPAATTLTMANTTTGSVGARIVVVTQGSDDDDKTVTLTGTDVYGTAQTETVTLHNSHCG